MCGTTWMLAAAIALAATTGALAGDDGDPEPTLAPPAGWRAAAAIGRALRATEGGRMAESIARGSNMGPGDGWFGPGSSRLGFPWLSLKFDADGDGSIAMAEFAGPPAWFDRLDRDRSGAIRADDFDWSGSAPHVRYMGGVADRFRTFDGDANGQLSTEEWRRVFDRLAAEKPGGLTPDDLADLFYLPARPRPAPAPPADAPPAQRPPDAGPPTRATLLKALANGEVGSLHAGPAVGDPAPDFTLSTRDRKQSVTLSQFRGERPVVLIFGSFT